MEIGEYINWEIFKEPKQRNEKKKEKKKDQFTSLSMSVETDSNFSFKYKLYILHFLSFAPSQNLMK